MTSDDVLDMLKRRGVITRDPNKEKCCGLERDEDGFCVHRPGHPIYVPSTASNEEEGPR